MFSFKRKKSEVSSEQLNGLYVNYDEKRFNVYTMLWRELDEVIGCSDVKVNRDGLCFVDFLTLDFAEYVDFTNCYDFDFWVRPDLERFVDVVVTFVGDTLVVS